MSRNPYREEYPEDELLRLRRELREREREIDLVWRPNWIETSLLVLGVIALYLIPVVIVFALFGTFK